MYDLLQSSFLLAIIGRAWSPIGEAVNRVFSHLSSVPKVHRSPSREMLADRVYYAALAVVLVVTVAYIAHFILTSVRASEVTHVFVLGIATLLRVIVVVTVATVVWVPLGVAIGFQPRLASTLQPVVQFLASFPSNLIFPFATLAFLTFHVPINVGCILLMALGSQWYILFNTIAGAQSIPTELREMTSRSGRTRVVALEASYYSWDIHVLGNGSYYGKWWCVECQHRLGSCDVGEFNAYGHGSGRVRHER